MRHRSPARGGMALVLALVGIVIVSTLLAGALMLSVSHMSLSYTNSSYANALNLAEAGVNWEFWKISQDFLLADNAPASVELPPGSNRSFQVHVEAYPGGGTWSGLGPFWVISTGTVDGVSRTVRVVARGYGLSGLYALFGIDELNVGGNATINGAVGTNGTVTVAGDPALNGNFIYCGDGAGGEIVTPVPPGEVMYTPLAESFPTVNELANLRAWEKYGEDTTLGVDFFATSDGGTPYNDNASITDTYGNPINILNYRVNNQTFLQAETDQQETIIVDGVTIPNPLYGKRTIVLGPGDYYFESFDVQGNNGIRVDDADGVVNIWLGAAGATGSADIIDGGSMFFTSQEPSKFHLYQGSKRALTLTGTMDIYGSIYAYNGPDSSGDYYGTINVLGDGNIWGSVIGYDVNKTTGSATINFPSTGGTGPGGPGPGPAPGEPIFFFGFDQSWEELNAL
jgi:hypothetical protein